jgi:hypothetical protein
MRHAPNHPEVKLQFHMVKELGDKQCMEMPNSLFGGTYNLDMPLSLVW